MRNISETIHFKGYNLIALSIKIVVVFVCEYDEGKGANKVDIYQRLKDEYLKRALDIYSTSRTLLRKKSCNRYE